MEVWHRFSAISNIESSCLLSSLYFEKKRGIMISLKFLYSFAFEETTSVTTDEIGIIYLPT